MPLTWILCYRELPDPRGSRSFGPNETARRRLQPLLRWVNYIVVDKGQFGQIGHNKYLGGSRALDELYEQFHIGVNHKFCQLFPMCFGLPLKFFSSLCTVANQCINLCRALVFRINNYKIDVIQSNF